MKKIINLLILLIPIVFYAQTRTVQGIVKDKSGYPIVGVSVYVPSSVVGERVTDETISNNAMGTLTDNKGEFSLSIPTSAKELTFSYDGFDSKTIKLTSKNKYEVTLKSYLDDIKLDEVVATGYQKIEKRKLASSVVDIEMDKINQKGVSSIDQMLQGQAAGVSVSPETGAPGQLSNIRIRGTSSLSGVKDPLWVIDGMPMEGNLVPDLQDKENIGELRNYSIAGLNPEDIASITVLKDASATSIYGARAANGVIIVTTKKGKKGRMTINFSANTFVNFMPDFDKINLLNSNQKVDLELAMAKRDDLSYRSGNGSVARILNAAKELDEYKKTGTITPETLAKINALRNNNLNWWNELYRSTINQQYTASVAGGGEKNTYYFSLGYYDEKASLKEVGLQRYNLSLKNDYQLNDRLKIGVTLLGTMTNRNSYLTDRGGFTNPNNYSRQVNPYQLIKDAEGNFVYDENINAQLQGDADFIKFNIIEERENTYNKLKTLQLISNFDLEYKIAKGITYNSLFGLQLEQNRNEKYAGENSYYNRAYVAGTKYYDKGNKYWLPRGGIIQNYNSDFFNYMWRNSVNIEKKLGLHEINVLAGIEIKSDKTEAITSKAFGFNDKNLTTQPVIFRNESGALSSLYLPYKKSEYENAYASYFGTASYTYDNKYTVFGSVRYDGSNLFGVNPKYKYLPIWSVAGAWNVSNESFFDGAKDIVSNFKIRASYGFQGNIDKGTSPYVVGEYGTASIIPGTTEDVITVTSPPNDKLRWEKTENKGIGVDLGFLRNRINVVFDLYNRKSTDLITQQNLSQETGFRRNAVNYGELTNKGFEISLNTINVQTEDFTWATGINLSKNENVIDKIQYQYANKTYRPIGEGKPIDAIWTIPYAGLNDEGLPTFYQGGKVVSAVDYFQLEDPYAAFYPGYLVKSNLSEEQMRALFQYRGSRSPELFGGLSNMFRYKDLELNIAGTFVYNKTVLARPAYNFTAVDPGLNYQSDILNAWTENNKTNLPRVIGRATIPDGLVYNWFNNADPSESYNAFDNFAKDLTYFRFTSIRLSYNIPNNLIKNMGISNFKLSLEGRNLFVISNGYDGSFDPETYGNIYAQPIQKSVTIGLNLQF